MDSALVAFSGGADSALLAFMAHQALGDQALAVTADSASLARSELRDAVAFAARFGLRHRVVPTSELEDEAYLRNSGDRCYFCKSALMHALEAISSQAAGATEILVGVNTDDLGGTTGPASRRSGSEGGGGRWWRWGCRRPRSAGCHASSGCRPGTSRRRPACRPASPTGSR